MFIIFMLLVFLGCMVLYILIPFGVTFILRKRFQNRIKKSGRIYLTFDDGPHPDSTPQILALLRKYNAKATFFVIGENVLKYPYIMRQIIDAGHEIGEHSFSHKFPWLCDPYRSLLDLMRGNRVLNDYRQVEDKKLFRPPYGKLNMISLIYVFLTQRKFVFWNVDPKDYKQDSGEKIADLVSKKLLPGNVILLHDGRRKLNKDLQTTGTAVEIILQQAKQKGIRLSTMNEIYQ